MLLLTSPPTRLDQVLTTVAFVLMMAGWVVGYCTVCPADTVAHRHAMRLGASHTVVADARGAQ